MNPLLSLSAAFGLSSAAGLNAYIPLLLVSLMANRGVIHLAPPYDVMGAWWCVALLAILCIIELVVDKIPGADHVNDIVQTFIRPTAGAVLFASQAGVISSAHPGVFIAIGLLTAGGVHTVKALARPPINIASVGLGAPIVSTLEDLVSTTLSLVALLAPVLVAVLMAIFGWILYRAFKRFVSKSRPIRVAARPVSEPLLASATLPRSTERNWGGGI